MRPFVVVPIAVVVAATAAAAQPVVDTIPIPKPQPILRHAFAFFTGVSTVMDSDETGVTISPTYRFRLTRRLAVGPIVGASFYPRRHTYQAAVAFHALPKSRVTAFVAPGVEITRPVKDDETDRDLVDEKTSPEVRVGFHIQLFRFGGVWLSPELTIDYGRTTETVVGLSIDRIF